VARKLSIWNPEERGMYKVYGPGVHRHIKYVLQQKSVTWCWVLGVGWLAEGFSYLRELVVVVERAENRSILALMRRRLRDDGSLF
jgi:hypothetical protein